MKAPTRFYSLDALRGMAALSVVLCHWRMWLRDEQSRLPQKYSADMLPFHYVLGFFDTVGYYAVGLFFSLSGFVFYWLYAKQIRSGAMGMRRFAVARFSRLYPLQLLSLLLVAAGQALYMNRYGGAGWVFLVNDPANFLKHLFIVPLWGRTRNYTFNGPDWTLAIEAFLYVLFFIVARLSTLGFATTVGLILAGVELKSWSDDMGGGVIAFFMGGLAYLIFERMKHGRLTEHVFRLLLAVAWPLTFVCGSHWIVLDATSLYWVGNWFPDFVLFPSTLLYLALVEARRERFCASVSWLGDITYSTYLLHFPLMLAIALALRIERIPFSVMASRTGLLLFLALLIPTAFASHRYLEIPVRDWLRSRLSGAKSAPPRSVIRTIDQPQSALSRERET